MREVSSDYNRARSQYPTQLLRLSTHTGCGKYVVMNCFHKGIPVWVRIGSSQSLIEERSEAVKFSKILCSSKMLKRCCSSSEEFHNALLSRHTLWWNEDWRSKVQLRRERQETSHYRHSNSISLLVKSAMLALWTPWYILRTQKNQLLNILEVKIKKLK